MAYHTGDPRSSPGRTVCRKSVRVSQINFYLPRAIPHTRYGGISKGTGGDV